MRKKLTKKTRSTHNLRYSGDITIKIMEGDRVYQENTYHNTGCLKLFNFLADCLTGNFNDARSSRPCRIVLFTLGTQETNSTIEGTDEGLTQANYDARNNEFYSNPSKRANGWNDGTCVSTKVYYDNTPDVLHDADGLGSTVSYHFRVPYLCLVDGAVVRKLGLYPNEISSYADDLCAYYVLSKAEKIQIPTGGSNFTIIVDWKLHIKNK